MRPVRIIEDRIAHLKHRLVLALGRELQASPVRTPEQDYRGAVAYVGQRHAWVETVWGGKLLVDTSDLLIAPYLLLDRIWEPDVTEFFQRMLKPGMTFIDVGANVGYFTVLAARLVGPTGRVFAFEPQRDTYELLAKSVIANWVSPYVTVENKAIFDRACTIDFFVRKNFPGNSSIGKVTDDHLTKHFDSLEKLLVPAVPLDEYLAGQLQVDLVKIDVEGAEVHAFRGMSRLLDANKDLVVVCEWSPEQIHDAGSKPAELVSEIQEHGLCIFSITEGRRPVSSAELLSLSYANLALMTPARAKQCGMG